jgi:hypothetical protein
MGPVLGSGAYRGRVTLTASRGPAPLTMDASRKHVLCVTFPKRLDNAAASREGGVPFMASADERVPQHGDDHPLPPKDAKNRHSWPVHPVFLASR